MRGVVAVALVLVLVSCGASVNRQAQMQVLNLTAKAANEAEQGIVLAYRFRLQKCLEDSFTRIDFDLCVSDVEQTYTKVRLSWDTLRQTQDEYAGYLETGKYNPEQFMVWFTSEYCNLKANLPDDVRLPTIPGLICEAAK